MGSVLRSSPVSIHSISIIYEVVSLLTRFKHNVLRGVGDSDTVIPSICKILPEFRTLWWTWVLSRPSKPSNAPLALKIPSSLSETAKNFKQIHRASISSREPSHIPPNGNRNIIIKIPLRGDMLVPRGEQNIINLFEEPNGFDMMYHIIMMFTPTRLLHHHSFPRNHPVPWKWHRKRSPGVFS